MLAITEKLFYKDSYIKAFTARVELCREKGEYYEVVLDRTAFFPEGGGQYADVGKLDDVKVLDVQEKEGIIYHVTESALEEGSTVEGVIDWDVRFMKMQQHTGEHIVSGYVNARFGYHNVGFHLGSEDCTMDFDGELTKEELTEIEHAVNESAIQNLEVLVSYPTKEELSALQYRSKIEIEGQVRIVTIPGCDVCACCAPHVKRTGEIGIIKLTHVQRYKGGARVTMLCGFRALSDYNVKEQQVQGISELLSVKEMEVYQGVRRLKEEYNQLKLKLATEQRKLLEYRACEVLDQETFACFFEEELEGEGQRVLMNLVLERGVKCCAVFVKNENGGWRYVVGSKIMDMRALAKELNEQFAGRGGGKPEMVQGSLYGESEEVRAWIQEKARNQENE